jgi:hypothetical protein
VPACLQGSCRTEGAFVLCSFVCPCVCLSDSCMQRGQLEATTILLEEYEALAEQKCGTLPSLGRG